MIKGMKTVIIKILPKPVLGIILNMKREKMKLIDLSLVSLIREKDLDYLSNPKLVESELLLELGLNNEALHEFPEELKNFCGKGLLHWQYPKQFSMYLTQLSKLKIESYLEIGVRHGGTFVITIEYLEKFHLLKNAVGIDIDYCPSLIEYKKINPKINFMKIDSQSSRFKKFITDHTGFDLVLIDGDHKETACRNDFETVRDKGNIIVFHDITSDVCSGVGRVWNQVKATYPDEYQFFEFIDQYESVSERTGQVFLGIGMAIKKKYLREIGLSP